MSIGAFPFPLIDARSVKDACAMKAKAFMKGTLDTDGTPTACILQSTGEIRALDPRANPSIPTDTSQTAGFGVVIGDSRFPGKPVRGFEPLPPRRRDTPWRHCTAAFLCAPEKGRTEAVAILPEPESLHFTHRDGFSHRSGNCVELSVFGDFDGSQPPQAYFGCINGGHRDIYAGATEADLVEGLKGEYCVPDQEFSDLQDFASKLPGILQQRWPSVIWAKTFHHTVPNASELSFEDALAALNAPATEAIGLEPETLKSTMRAVPDAVVHSLMIKGEQIQVIDRTPYDHTAVIDVIRTRLGLPKDNRTSVTEFSDDLDQPAICRPCDVECAEGAEPVLIGTIGYAIAVAADTEERLIAELAKRACARFDISERPENIRDAGDLEAALHFSDASELELVFSAPHTAKELPESLRPKSNDTPSL